jgi:Icc-related predicted phosphoesterase
MVRIATAGDVHCGAHDADRVRAQFAGIEREADVLLLAGDLTNHGTPDEMNAVAAGLADVVKAIPVYAVFGNHDVHAEMEAEARAILEAAGITVLEQEVAVLDVNGVSIGIAGAKGFCGGFRGGCASMFGEREMRVFLKPTIEAAAFFGGALRAMDTDVRVALMHFAPVPETLFGERWELFPFLGAYQLGEAIDDAGCDLALHGHAHRGTEKGQTPGGVPVRNVAQAVLGKAYAVYEVASKTLTKRIPAALPAGEPALA